MATEETMITHLKWDEVQMFLGTLAVVKVILVPNINLVRLRIRGLLSFLLFCHGEDIYHGNGHKNGFSNK